MRKPSFLFGPKPGHRRRFINVPFVLAFLLFLPLAAHASPFDTGISNVSTLFTGTAAKAGSRRRNRTHGRKRDLVALERLGQNSPRHTRGLWQILSQFVAIESSRACISL